MSRKTIPAYRRQCVQAGQNRAFVELNGKRHYLGCYGSPESRQEYARLLAEWETRGRQLPVPAEEITTVELSARYLAFAEKRYGHSPDEMYHVKKILRLMRENGYGTTKAKDFGPLALKALREKLVGEQLLRSTVNREVIRIRRIFKWAVAEQLILPETLQALQAVDGLRRGESEARESEPVRPVPQEHIDAVRGRVARQVWTLIQLQLLTAARSGELVIMRPVDLDTSEPVWIFEPREHKTAHHGHERTIFLGPRAQEVLRPFLKDRPPGAFLFSPQEAEEERRAALHAARKTPLSCGNVPGSNRSRAPKCSPRERYDVNSYGRAIARACKAAEIPSWHPHQLRHNAATYLRKEFGIDTARIILGHRSATITEVYAELDRSKALDVMSRIG